MTVMKKNSASLNKADQSTEYDKEEKEPYIIYGTPIGKTDSYKNSHSSHLSHVSKNKAGEWGSGKNTLPFLKGFINRIWRSNCNQWQTLTGYCSFSPLWQGVYTCYRFIYPEAANMSFIS